MLVVVVHAGCMLEVFPAVQEDMRTSGILAATAHSGSTAAVRICSSPSIGGRQEVAGPSVDEYGHGSSLR